MRKLIIVGLAVVVAVAAGYYLLANRNGDRPTYRLVEATTGPIVSRVSSTGTLGAVVSVQVGSQISGQIKELHVDYNSEVKKDQIIALIDPENFDARVQQAEADLGVAKANVIIQMAGVERAKADLETGKAALNAAKAQVAKAEAVLLDAERNLARQKALFQTSAVSRSQIDTAQANFDQAKAALQAALAEQESNAAQVISRQAQLKTAEAQVEQAKAQVVKAQAALNQAKIDLDHTIIRSPVDGVVVERAVDIGQTVAASLQAPKLFVIAQDLRQMKVDVNVDEADVGRIAEGQRVSFSVDAFPGRDFSGRVEQIRMAPQTVQNVVTYTVVVSTDNSDLRLLPGMTANVQVLVDERPQALKIPNAALRFRPLDAAPAGAPAGQAAAAGPGQGGGAAGQERLARLVEALKLTPEQQAQAQAGFDEMRQRLGALRSQGANPEETKAEADRLRKQSQEALVALLTPEQRQKYRELQAAQTASGGPGGTPGRVYVLDSAGKPKALEVSVGLNDGSSSEVIRGELKPGQKVIVGLSQPGKKPALPPAGPGGPRFGL